MGLIGQSISTAGNTFVNSDFRVALSVQSERPGCSVYNLPRASSDAPLRIGAKPREPPLPLGLEAWSRTNQTKLLLFLVQKLLFLQLQQEEENVQAVLTGCKVSVCSDLGDSESKANKLHRKQLALQERFCIAQYSLSLIRRADAMAVHP